MLGRLEDPPRSCPTASKKYSHQLRTMNRKTHQDGAGGQVSLQPCRKLRRGGGEGGAGQRRVSRGQATRQLFTSWTRRKPQNTGPEKQKLILRGLGDRENSYMFEFRFIEVSGRENGIVHSACKEEDVEAGLSVFKFWDQFNSTCRVQGFNCTELSPILLHLAILFSQKFSRIRMHYEFPMKGMESHEPMMESVWC